MLKLNNKKIERNTKTNGKEKLKYNYNKKHVIYLYRTVYAKESNNIEVNQKRRIKLQFNRRVPCKLNCVFDFDSFAARSLSS